MLSFLTGGKKKTESAATASAQLATVRRINYILESCGVARSHALSQIYSSPEVAHVVSDEDLRFLTKNAQLLASHKNINCDFEGFSMMLLGNVHRASKLISFISSDSESASSPGTPSRSMMIPSANVVRMHQEDVFRACYSTLSRAVSVSIIMRAFEQQNIDNVLKKGNNELQKLHIVQKDVEMLITLLTRCNLLVYLLCSKKEYSGRLSVRDYYSVSGHTLARTAELAAASFTHLLSLLASRPKVDVVPILKYFNSPQAWEVSGCGVFLTESYCRSIKTMLIIMHQRRKSLSLDKESFVEMTVKLLVNRVMVRPPFCWETFKILFFTSKTYVNMQEAKRNPNDPNSGYYLQFGVRAGLLHLFYKVQCVLEEVLVIVNEKEPKPLFLAKQAIRHAVSRRLDELIMQEATTATAAAPAGAAPGSTLLSFYHLVAFAAVKGMPEAALNDDPTLLRRAKQTQLCSFQPDLPLSSLGFSSTPGVHAQKATDLFYYSGAADNYANPSPVQYMLDEPAFLRLLLASAFVVPVSCRKATYDHTLRTHAHLSGKSLLALYNSIERFFFFIPLGIEQPRVLLSVPVSLLPSRSKQLSGLVRLLLEEVRYWSSLSVAWEEDAQWNVGGSDKSNADVAADQAAAPATTTPTAAPTAADGTSTSCDSSGDSPYRSAQVPLEMFARIKHTVTLLFQANEEVAENERRRNTLELIKTNLAVTNKTKANFSLRDYQAMTLNTVESLAVLLCSPDFVRAIPHYQVVEVVSQLFALRMLHDDRYKDLTAVSPQARKNAQLMLVMMEAQLRYMPTKMSAASITRFFLNSVVPKVDFVFYENQNNSSSSSSSSSGSTAGGSGAKALGRATLKPNKLHVAHLEGYLRTMATTTAANAIPDEHLLRHWIDVALPCLLQRDSSSLAIAAHNFLIAPILARKTVAPLFVPTYVAVFVPTRKETVRQQGQRLFATDEPSYPEPPLFLVRRFAETVRSVCQALEGCDATKLAALVDNSESILYRVGLPSLRSRDSRASSARTAASASCGSANVDVLRQAFTKLTPSSSVLLIVSALFDSLCQLWNSPPREVQEAQQRFMIYFSSLVNLLQCENSHVLHRVCASIEAMELEHLRGSAQLQVQLLKYIGETVDRIHGTSKKNVVKWYLTLSEKVLNEHKTRSKL